MKLLLASCLCLLYAHMVKGQDQKDTLQPFICRMPESIPDYPGGSKKMGLFMQQHLVLPDSLQELQGRVLTAFTVLEDGSLDSIRVIRSLHPVADSMALQMIRQMPKWNPGKFYDKPVKVSYLLPVIFKAE